LPTTIRQKVVTEKISVNERIIEHPWVFMNMGIDQGRILDVGCCYSSLAIQLASLGFEVWGIDIATYGLAHCNFKFVQEDICQTTLSDEFFDRVLAISTLEHLGLGHYGDPLGQSKDKEAMRQIYRVLKPEGRLMMSVPFGKSLATPSFRVYDSRSLEDLIQPFWVENKSWFVHRGSNWLAAAEQEASSQGLDERGRPTAVVLLIGKKL
jgi:2-polyprenyl-3-methyl-5-hydroxy-6-metoxy-1,4-benzoquinol methylase